MNTESTTMARPSPAQEAEAAQQAVTGQAKAENLNRIAELSDGTDDAHVAEHIRGVVAATMSHLSADAPALTRHNAEQWQNWALGVADGVAATEHRNPHERPVTRTLSLECAGKPWYQDELVARIFRSDLAVEVGVLTHKNLQVDA